MTTVIVCLMAFVSTMAFLILWFWVVRRELRGKTNMVQSAEIQLRVCRQRYQEMGRGQEKQGVQDVLARSEDIYHQSVMLYNQALKKPQNSIAGFLMGFRQIREDDAL